MPLEGLNLTQRILVSSAFGQVLKDAPVLTKISNSPVDWITQMTPQRRQSNVQTVGKGTAWRTVSPVFKVVNVTPAEDGYTFDLYNSNPDMSLLYFFSVPEVRLDYIQQIEDPLSDKITTLMGDDLMATKIDLGFGDGWDSHTLKAAIDTDNDNENDAKLEAEVWTNYPSSDQTDYLVGGWWVILPDEMVNTDGYHLGSFARPKSTLPRNAIQGLEGKATYKGSMNGLHISSENSFTRLGGKVTLKANFGTATVVNSYRRGADGSIEGIIDNLTLNGENVSGSLYLNEVILSLAHPTRHSHHNKETILGNIDETLYTGSWALLFSTGTTDDPHPTGIAGTMGGSGGGNSFVASFGAKKVEDE